MGELAKTFGGRVRALRKERGLTQAQLGDAATLSEEWVRRIERGEASPSFDTIKALSDALRAEPAELFRAADPDPLKARLVDQIGGLAPEEVGWLADLVGVLRRRP